MAACSPRGFASAGAFLIYRCRIRGRAEFTILCPHGPGEAMADRKQPQNAATASHAGVRWCASGRQMEPAHHRHAPAGTEAVRRTSRTTRRPRPRMPAAEEPNERVRRYRQVIYGCDQVVIRSNSCATRGICYQTAMLCTKLHLNEPLLLPGGRGLPIERRPAATMTSGDLQQCI
jgi:hypothetical protein